MDAGTKRQASRATPRYHRILGVTSNGRRSGLEKWYELLVVGKDEVGALSRLTNLLAQHEVNLAPSGGYYTISPKTFVWTTFANFMRSESPLERVLGELSRLEFVTHVEAVVMRDVAIDEFLFPVMITDKARGIIMSLEPLVNMERRLIEQFGQVGTTLMYEEGRQYALHNLRQLREAMQKTELEDCLDLATAWLRATGWGIFEFDTARLETAGRVEVSIRDPPNAAASGVVRSHFTEGATAGIIESALGKTMRVVSSEYDESRRTLSLHFETVG